MRSTKIAMSIMTTAALAIGLTGCIDTPGPTPVAPPAVEQPAGDSAEIVPDIATGTFGESGFTFDDGLRVDISEPTSFTPTEWAMADDAPHYLKYTVKITNGTPGLFDPSMFFTTLSSGGAEMAEVFDDGLEGSPMTPVLPGKSVSFDIGYPALDPNDITMSVEADYDHASILFTSEAAR